MTTTSESAVTLRGRLQEIIGSAGDPYDWQANVALFAGASDESLSRIGDAHVLQLPGTSQRHSAPALSIRGADLAGSIRDTSFFDISTVFQRVDLATCDAIKRAVGAEHLDVFEDRRFFDYIYSINEQVALDGTRFSRRRTYLRACEKDNDLRSGPLNLSDERHVAAVHRVSTAWRATRPPGQSIDHETTAIGRCLTRELSHLSRGVGVWRGPELIGYGIYSFSGFNSVCHFAKSERSGPASALLWQTIFTDAQQRGVRSMNCGYDGGLSGLRAAKLNLKPSAVAPRFSIVRIA